MNKKTKPSTYESPLVHEEALNIEQGFAQSGINSAAANYETINDLGEI